AFYLENRDQILKVISEGNLVEFCAQYGQAIILLVLDASEGPLLSILIAQKKIPSGTIDERTIGRRENKLLLLPKGVGLLVIKELAKIGIGCPLATESFEIPKPQGDIYSTFFGPRI
ncbi:MAG: hypothetical protein AAB612_00110, partial [Patescibacteria group bacterium]